MYANYINHKGTAAIAVCPSTNTSSLTTVFMRNLYTKLLMGLLLFCGVLGANAQVVNVDIPGNTTPALLATYPSMAAAITDVNNRTAISGPVTLTLTAAQTAPAGGYVIQNVAISGQSNTNRITFDGGGNTITAGVGTSATIDGIIKILGTDFLTIQNFVLVDPITNTTGTTQVEWGIALLYSGTTNGSQNIILQNNSITLQRININSFGIYSNSVHAAGSVSTSATATTAAGGNSGLKIYGNTISNINMGIVIVGPTPSADANTGIDIGGTGGIQANTISNFGTSNAISSYNAVSGTVNGILVRNSNGFNISFNSISSSVGGTILGTLNGIQIPASSTAPTTTFTNTISNNSISLQSAVTTGSIVGISYPSGSASATSTANINSNNFHTFGHTVTGASGSITFITLTSANQVSTINSNSFTNIAVNTTGNVTFISQSFAASATCSKTVNGNQIITGFTKTGAAGTVTFITDNGATVSGAVSNCQNNNFSNVNLTGANAVVGISFTESGSAPARTVTGNTLSNITTGAATINLMNFSSFNGASSISTNTINNINGQGNITGITIGLTINTSPSVNISGNTITNLTSSGTGGIVTGISSANTSSLININNNIISGLSSTGASAVTGINILGATTTNVFKNRICLLSGSNASSTVSGIQVVAGTTVSLSNNRVAELTAPIANAANPIVGINITGGTAVNVDFNSVHIAAGSTGSLFGTSAISASTTPTLTLRSNIFSNASTASGAGVIAAYLRSSTTLTSYAAASDRNDFVAPVLFSDGTNTITTLAAYKTFVAPSDANSISVAAPFLSTSCNDANFLKVNTAIPTFLESGGEPVTGISDDFENEIRQGNGGYSGTGTRPDIGADEFAGTLPSGCNGTPAASAINAPAPVCANTGLTLSINTAYTEQGIAYQWASSTVAGGPYSTILGTNATQPTGNLAATTYFIVTISCTQSGQSFTTPEQAVVVNPVPTVTVSPSSAIYCSPGGTAITLTANGASTYTWAPAAGLSPATGAIVSASPGATTTYTVTGTNGFGCTGTATAVITVSNMPVVIPTASPAALCSGANSQLNAVTSSNAIKITEVTQLRTGTGATAVYPAYIGAAEQDFVEISNLSAVPVDISGWVLEDYATNSSTVVHPGFAFPSGTIIPANGVSVIHLGPGTNSPANLYFNTGGTIDSWFATSSYGIVLKNGASVLDAVGRGNPFVFHAGTGVTGSDWSGNLATTSAAGIIRTSALDNNTGSDWVISTAVTLATIGTYNGGYTYSNIVAYLWSPSTFIAGQETLQNPVAMGVTANTTYTVTVTSAAGCSASGNVTVMLAPLICGPLTTAGAACIGTQTVTAHPSAGGLPYIYSWTEDGNAFGGNTATISPSLGTHTYVCTITDNCSGSCSSSLAVTTAALPTVSVTPTSGVICSPGGAAISLTANGASSYAWAPATGLSAATGVTVSALPAITTTYTVTGTDANGCTNTAAALITVNAIPQNVVATATPAAVCSGSTTSLSVTSTVPFPASLYTFGYTAAAAALDPMTGATTVVGSSVDNAPMALSGTTAGASQPIGFTVQFEGQMYTHFSASPDGWVRFLNAATAATAHTTNSVTSTANVPKIYPFWDDLSTGTDGNVTALVTGTAPNRIFKVQWFVNIPKNLTGPANSTFQAWIYETSGKIEYHYGTMGTATSTTISAGLTGTPATNFQSISFFNNSSSNTTANNLNGTLIPSAGTLYSYTAPTYSLNYAWSPSGDVVSPTSQTTLTQPLTATQSFSVVLSNGGCAAAPATVSVVVNSCGSDITVTAFLEGYYLGGGAMINNLEIAGVAGATSLQADTVEINLWNPADLLSPTPHHSQRVIISTSGVATASFPGATGNWWLAVKHRNHLETWSAAPINMVPGATHNFTINQSSAFADVNSTNTPMKVMADGKLAFYGGDVDQDGTVAGSDMNEVDNGTAAFDFGYNRADCNGDGETSGADMNIVDNNTSLFLFYARPF